MGYNTSYAWQSLMEGQKLLEAGLGWRVGYGPMISVWSDAWIDDPGNPRVVIPIGDNNTKMGVANLIIERGEHGTGEEFASCWQRQMWGVFLLHHYDRHLVVIFCNGRPLRMGFIW